MAKILIAEDEPDIQELISLTLQHAGHEVVRADDGEMALKLLPGARPDLVLLDVRMPHLNGIETCRRIKEDPAFKHLPVVFLSVRGMDREMRQGFDAGAAAYLIKPFSPTELVERVKEILRPPAPPEPPVEVARPPAPVAVGPAEPKADAAPAPAPDTSPESVPPVSPTPAAPAPAEGET